MTKSLKNLSDRLLFRDRGIVPTKWLLITLLFVSVLMVGLSFINVSWLFVFIINGIVLALSLFDALLSPKRNELLFKRRAVREFERDLPYEITIQVKNNSTKVLRFKLVDDLPQSFHEAAPLYGEVPAQEDISFTYSTAAPVRGDYELKKLYVRYTSSLGLWAKQLAVTDKTTVKVIPDLTDVKAYLQDAQKFLLHEGLKIKKQQVGMGEFASIRNYVVGDDPRMINWHQTAKLQEVMTNVYEPEHGKYITILIDCGRMMGVELSEGNRLERVLESALTVAASALHRGDYVAVIAFSKQVHSYIPPEKGIAHLQTILNELYNLQVEPVESNYREVFNYVETMLNKRSLLFLFSDVQTFLHNENMLAHLIRIKERHLFFMIGLEDIALVNRAESRPERVDKAMIKSIAQYQLLEKRRERARWEQRGLQLVEAEEESLTVTAVSYYIDLMNRGLL